MKKFFYLFVLLIILLGSQVSRSQSVFSDFTFSRDGWWIDDYHGHFDTNCFVSTGGNPGGYIAVDNESVAGPSWFRASYKFSGDMRGAYNRTLSFDMLLSDTTRDTTSAFKYTDILIAGSVKDLYFYLPHDTMPGLWQHFLVVLNENSGWHLATGEVPTQEEFMWVLESMEILEIKGKYTDNPGTGGIDNVYLSTSSPISTFDNDYDGWRVIGDVQGGSGMPNYHPTGGNPGGYLSAVDDATGDTWYWQAPGKFLGNKEGTYGQYLTFDIKQSDLINQFDDYDLILQGPTYNLVFNTPNNPDTTWTSYSILMTESAGWRIDDTLGAVPTQQQFKSVLSNLQNLFIRGEFIVGEDSGCIDNVRLGTVTEISEHEILPGQLVVFPNPAKEYLQLSLNIEQGGFYDFSLTGVSGEQGVLRHRFYLSNGKQVLKVSLGNVTSGLYVAEMRSGSTVFRGKVVVE